MKHINTFVYWGSHGFRQIDHLELILISISSLRLDAQVCLDLSLSVNGYLYFDYATLTLDQIVVSQRLAPWLTKALVGKLLPLAPHTS
jgi:hypothetical protein